MEKGPRVATPAAWRHLGLTPQSVHAMGGYKVQGQQAESAAGLVDEVAMDVAPVVLGEGVRFFGSHTGTVLLDDPDHVVQGDRVLHLRYRVRR